MTYYRGILFDLDGVLINSEPSYTRFWNEIDAIYPTGVVNFANIIKGNSLSKILEAYFSADVHDDIKSRLLCYERTVEYPPFRETFSLLVRLRSLRIKIALVTSSNNDKMANLYSQHPRFKSFFDAIVTADDVTASKPDPQGYLIAANLLGVDTSQCVVVEDSPAGLEAGLRSGALVCGLTTTVSADVVRPKCDIMLDNVADIVNVVSNVKSANMQFA